jgi:hypothetical protein
MHDILSNFYLHYCPRFYPSSRDIMDRRKRIVESLTERWPTSEELAKGFPYFKMRYIDHMNGIERLMLFNFSDDSVCLERHSPDGNIRMVVVENQSNWIATMKSIPFWTDFTKDFNHYKVVFDEARKTAIVKNKIQQQ